MSCQQLYIEQMIQILNTAKHMHVRFNYDMSLLKGGGVTQKMTVNGGGGAQEKLRTEWGGPWLFVMGVQKIPPAPLPRNQLYHGIPSD